MKASECKAKFLAVLDEVARTGEPVTVTKNGTPVGQIVPCVTRPKSLFGALKGYFEIKGDIVAPLHGDWDAERELALIEGRLDETSARHAHRGMAARGRSKPRAKGARTV